jgi:hypothetical protein
MNKYNCSREDAAYGIVPQDWWRQELEPKLKTGEMVTPALARSMKDNDVSIVYVAKHYPDQWPQYVSTIDARVIQKTF